MSEDKIGGETADELVALKEISEESQAPQRVPADREKFNTLMQEQQAPMAQGKVPGEVPQQTTLIDTVRDLNYSPNKSSPTVSTDKLISQTKEAINRIEEIKHTLSSSPDAHIKTSFQGLLQNKLTHINESLKIALSRAGIEFNPTEGVASKDKTLGGAVTRFLGFLSDGQGQLENLGTELQTMSDRGKDLTPVNMLAIQVKVGQIQQELELFSSLLNKALESIKTIMNIQV